MDKKNYKILNISIISACFSCILVFMLVFTRPTVSVEEKRDLTVFPVFTWSSLIAGEYTTNVALYYNDTVPMREFFKGIAADVRSVMGIRYGGVIISGGVTPDIEKLPEIKEEPITEPNSELEAISEPEPEPEPNPDIFGEGVMENGVLTFKDRGFSCFGGGIKNGQLYASYLNTYKEQLPEVNIYSLVAPTSQTYYMPEKYLKKYGSEPNNIQNINDHLIDVKPVDAYRAMLAHKDENLYFRTDHHWAPLGAYYSAQEFAKVADVPFADLDTYERVERDGFVGSFYTFTNLAVFKNNPEDFIFYKPANEYVTDYYDISFNFTHSGQLLTEAKGGALYCTFMGGDSLICHVNTDCKNGRTLLVIKDSYGNALIPFFTGSFENIYVADMRYFNPNAIQFAKANGVTDILFAMNSFSAVGPNLKHIERIRTQ